MLSGPFRPENVHPMDPWFYPITTGMSQAMTVTDMSSVLVVAAATSPAPSSLLLRLTVSRPARAPRPSAESRGWRASLSTPCTTRM